MKVIVLDCEFNQPSGKLIQIGAVLFDPANGRIFDTYMQFVNPNEPLNPEIVQLTRITDEMLKNAPDVKQAALNFTQWKEKNQANPIPITWGAGTSNDAKRIYDEAQVESPFTKRIIDTKGVYQMLANASSGHMRQKVGLKTAMENCGLEWDYRYGAPHDALADAHNTMRIYMFLSKCLKGGASIAEAVREE